MQTNESQVSLDLLLAALLPLPQPNSLPDRLPDRDKVRINRLRGKLRKLRRRLEAIGESINTASGVIGGGCGFPQPKKSTETLPPCERNHPQSQQLC